MNPSNRYLSAELEINSSRTEESRRDNRAVGSVVNQWGGAIVHDGSVGGYEINTAPASGDLFVAQIRAICAALAETHSDVDRRCGYHIHIDARDFNYYDLRRLIKLYARIEPALFEIVPPSRRTNTYCQKCGDRLLKGLEDAVRPGETKRVIIENIYGAGVLCDRARIFRDRKRQKYDHSRYNALNLHSWFFRGTVECRLAAGTTNADKIINWGILWASILDYAYKTPERRIDALRGNPLQILLRIAPTRRVKRWIRERHARFLQETPTSPAGATPASGTTTTTPSSTSRSRLRRAA